MEHTGNGAGGPPERVITPNQIAAYNMQRFRIAAGLTQEQLGAELGGWTKNAVSAAERTWDGTGRGRIFGADLICDLAAILRVPVMAFFLPPADDGDAAAYAIGGADGPVPMAEYASFVLPGSGFEADSPAGAACQQAVITATARYTGADEALGAVAEAAGDLVAKEQIRSVLKDAQATREGITGLYELAGRLLEENALLQDALGRALAAGGGAP